MKHYMGQDDKRGLILTIMVAVALLAAFYHIASYTPPTPPLDIRRERVVRGDLELFYMIKTVISTVNVALLAFLLATYIDIYRKIKSEFTIALMIFSALLLLYALSANSLVHRAFGFRAFGLGPFAMLSDLFTCIAASILVYLNFKY